MSKIAVIDSSVWIEILCSGSHVKRCQAEIDAYEKVIVPVIVIYEVYKKLKRISSEEQALSSITVLKSHTVQDFTQEVALTASDLSIQYKLGMADSTVLAHAVTSNAILITLDHDFAKIDSVKVIH